MSATIKKKSDNRNTLNAFKHGLTARRTPTIPDSEVENLASLFLENSVDSDCVRQAAFEAAHAVLHLRNVSKRLLDEMNRIATQSTAKYRFDEQFKQLAWIDWRRIPRNPNQSALGVDIWKPFHPPRLWMERWLAELADECHCTDGERAVRAMEAVLLTSARPLITLATYERKARSRRDKALNRLDYIKLEAARRVRL